MHIFCDEAGFTGNKLRDADQDVFAYASVAIHPDAAHELVERTRKDFRLQGKELKGSALLKHEHGKRAIAQILTECKGKYKVVAHLKPYALTSKLFEYIFEPAVSNFNSFLYDIGFNRFIATLLFLHLRVQNKPAEELLDHFITFAHRGDVAALEAIFPAGNVQSYTESPLQAIGLFAMLHKDEITSEILGAREPGVPNWILDLTTTSLFNLLAAWGERYDELEVTCDESKPIRGDMQVFDAMVGRTEKKYFKFRGEEHPFIFNLKHPLVLGKSDEHPGIQIADVIAAVTAKVFSNKYRGIKDPDDKEWIKLIRHHLHDSIWPDLSDADLDQRKCFVNTVILNHLIDRSVAGKSLSRGIRQVAMRAHLVHPLFMRDTGHLRRAKAQIRKPKS